MLVSNFFRFNTLPATYNFKAERRDKFDTLNMGTKDRVSDGHILFQMTLIKKKNEFDICKCIDLKLIS